MRNLLLILLLAVGLTTVNAQTKTTNPRPLTMAEYDKAKKYTIADLDKDTYVKFDNIYILDRYEARKPYFVTGDDGLKKRIDLYKFLAKEGLQELGVMVFYTNEKGKLYQALVPNFTAEGAVWEKYFQDIDNINKEEKNFILKLSYILSKELSFQQYKILNSGKNLSEEAGTYGSDICFPGDEVVAMANGNKKLLKDVKPGDEVLTIDPVSKSVSKVVVKALTTHEAKNYAITNLTLIASESKLTTKGKEIKLHSKFLKATPNHPMLTKDGQVKIGAIKEGQEVLCLNELTGKYDSYTVFKKDERAGGNQKVYNMVANAGTTFIMNGVMVLQK